MNDKQRESAPLQRNIVLELKSYDQVIRPDDVPRLYNGIQLTLKILPADDGEAKPTVLVEGDRRALLFLADLILAQVADELDCGFHLSPSWRGFSGKSDCGLYVHSLPCAEPER